jgi:3-oxoadipate CoA-transferase alpha subunit
MIDKRVNSAEEAIAGLGDGATILIGGFGESGFPFVLMEAVADSGVRDLQVVCNNGGTDGSGLATLIAAGRVRRILCSYPQTPGATAFPKAYAAGKIEVELVPQGIISERLRCAAAGLGGVLSPVGVGTRLAEGKQVQTVDGRDYILELPLKGDFALIRADRADRWGNLTYRKSARNFNPVMASAAETTIVEVREMVALGALDEEAVVTPGIFIDRVLVTG